MASVSTYLYFDGHAEKAFAFYKDVFGTAFSAPIMHYDAAPDHPDMPALSEADKKRLVMHVALPILGGHVLMGCDVVNAWGMDAKVGTNIYISLLPDTRQETDALFNALAVGGTVQMPMQEMFWGGYYGSLTDQFGIQWMFNCNSK